MRFCRFLDNKPHYGLIETRNGEEVITRVAKFLRELGVDETLPTQWHDPVVPIKLREVPLLAPVQPGKIVCVGRNYKEHASELGNEVPKEPLLFLKPPSAVIGPGQKIELPGPVTERVDFEGELGVVIGKPCRNLSDFDEVRPYILGYTVVNDVTARDLQKKDGQWTRAKGFDTFCPVGPIVTDEVDPWKGLQVETFVNGERRQSGNTTEFIFPLDQVIRYISRIMTLFPGDLISTGTPSGVGPLKTRDTVEVKVQGIGTLSNIVE